MTPTTKAISTYISEKRATGTIKPTTARNVAYVLTSFAEACPDDPARITRRHVLRWLGGLTHLAAGTRRLHYGMAHGFTAWLLTHGTLAKDPFADVARPRVPRSAHRALPAEHVAALLAACEAPRERVVVVLGLATGLRRAELTALEVGDVDLFGRTVFVRHGKGDRPRTVPLSTEAAAVVAAYVAGEGLSHGPLLRSLADPQRGILPETLGGIFRRLAYRSGVKVRARDGVGVHSTRHTAASRWYEATGDVLAVRDLLGHESLSNTARYVRGFGVERLRSTVESATYLDAA